MALGSNRWGKSEVRVSKVLPGDADDFVQVSVQVLLEGDVADAHVSGDNANVLPTDTMRNTIYGLAQDHLTHDLEGFAEALAGHFLAKEPVDHCAISVAESIWRRETNSGFIGGGSERRIARIGRGREDTTRAGVDGLVVLKTRGSSFERFPRDEFTVLPEAGDRLLSTSITAEWEYTEMPADTTETWERVREVLVDRFFSDWSASVQHQGFLMGEAVLAEVEEISSIEFRLPNQHHLPFDLTRFGMEWHGTVFHPVSEPFGDIYLTVER